MVQMGKVNASSKTALQIWTSKPKNSLSRLSVAVARNPTLPSSTLSGDERGETVEDGAVVGGRRQDGR